MTTGVVAMRADTGYREITHREVTQDVIADGFFTDPPDAEGPSGL